MQINAVPEHDVKLNKLFAVRQAPFRYNPRFRESPVFPSCARRGWTT
jgi:hypothetical protein